MTRGKRTYNATKIPGLPKVPSDISPQAKRYLEMLTEAVEIRLGRRGDARDSAVTFRDLFDAGLASEGPWVFNQSLQDLLSLDQANSCMLRPYLLRQLWQRNLHNLV